MSLFKLDKSYFDTFKILAKPKRFFSSSSSGITGSLPVFPGASIAMKEVTTSTSDVLVDEGSIEAIREDACKLDLSPAQKYDLADEYMTMVNAENANIRRTKKMEVLRFEPSVRFTSDTIRKGIVKNVLFPFYKVKYGKACNWAVTNYNTLNFFSTVDDTVPDDTVLMYPASGSYTYRPTGSFSFEFYLNPRYHEVGRDMAFGAGTIFHMSSSYALSLITGSAKDNNGLADGYRLLLQLSHSAELLPSQCPIGLTGVQSDPHDFIFSSSDNSLRKNHWHHCCVRWDNNTQNSTGSFVIDGSSAGTFNIPTAALSGSYLQRELPTTTLRGSASVNAGPADVLFIGNFYDGPNSRDPALGAPEDFTAQFFNPVTAYADGITNYYAPTHTHDSPGPVTEPDDFTFAHPLNAEVHELKIYDRYRTDADIATARISGPDSLISEKAAGLLFYVPPFFTKDTNTRNVLQTPFQTARGSTDDPFNVPLSFGIGGHYLNLENFVKELVLGKFPRLYNLSASTIDTQTGWSTANNYLFTTGSVRKRNLSILPNDNGLFIPNFSILEQTAANTGSLSLFTLDDGTKDLSLINLNVLVPTASIGTGLLGSETPGSISEALQGASPDDPSVPAGSILTIYNRTRDPSSNEITIFDACNLFYGNKIDPGTYILKDTAVTGSGGRVAITLRDHTGSLYRADAITPCAKWSSVGALLYEEGISVVKTPLVPRFGADQFSVDLFGQQNIHMLRMDIPAERGDLDLSTNSSYKELSPTDQSADKDVRFSYITNVNLLDENLNVISKVNFSQPIIKRENDRFIIRVKLDF